MRRVLVGLGLGWVLIMGTLASVVLNPAGDSPAASGASSLTLLAASAAKEGQGDLLCGPPGKAGPGASVAAMAAARAGFTGSNLVTAVAVAGAESGWNPNATNHNTNGSTDFGMWQINTVHATLLASGDWADPYDNAVMAHRVWVEAGGSWTPWVTFNHASHLRFWAQAQAAVDGAPVAQTQPCVVSAGGSGGSQTGTDNITAWTRAMMQDVDRAFPGHTIGCYRPGTWGEHRFGRACDFMTGTAQGNQIAGYVQANAARLHVLYIIWRQHVWSPARAAEGWRLMNDRGSPTANHMDHVHVSVCTDSRCLL